MAQKSAEKVIKKNTGKSSNTASAKKKSGAVSTAKKSTSKKKSAKKENIKDLSEANDKKKKDLRLKGSLIEYPFLLEIKPNERYLFRSNDYKCDDQYCTILSYFHKDGAFDDFPAFWGINRVPTGLANDVSVTCVQSVERLSDGWVKNHQQSAENIATMNSYQQSDVNNKTSATKANKRENDLTIIAEELQAGATYLQCAFRIQIRAKSYEQLVDSIHTIERLYVDRFSTLYATSYDGEQAKELSSLLRPIAYKKGKPFYFTSTELAGEYSLITRGIEDNEGDYVGEMKGDVNTAAVLFDIDDYSHHIIVGSEQLDDTYYRAHVTDLWGSKISQACLMNNHKVAHIILDDCQLDLLGPGFDTISREINMNKGDINMFELFGDYDDELSLFAMQMRKLILMAEQAYESTPEDRSIIRGSLEEVATKFYIEQRMWVNDAANNRDRVRVVGIPHQSIPKLEMFTAYLDTEYKALVGAGSGRDPEKLHAISVLNLTFKNLLANNGDLFNTTTNSVIDEMRGMRRTIYRFDELFQRSSGIMMAQLINILAFVCSTLGAEDTLIIHGAEFIDDSVKDYVDTLLLQLYNKHGRVCFLYNDIDRMLADQQFSYIDKADYTILGNMTDNECKEYQKVLGQTIPSNMVKIMVSKNDNKFTYIHRDYQNVIFDRDFILMPKYDI